MDTSLLIETDSGLYCPAGDFYVDPWRPVAQAVITHGHSDHARSGMGQYLTVSEGASILRTRLGEEAEIASVGYGEAVRLGEATVSFHPAGHILGSAQIRVESRGLVWVVSGDYKTAPDGTCAPFEPVRCHGYITEATFALPVYRWKPQAEIFAEVNAWWRSNRNSGKASLLYCYALGKAQRILAGVDASIGSIYTHGAVERLTELYRAAGVALPATQLALNAVRKDFAGALVLAPPSAAGSPWTRRLGDYSTALASGWMQIRGARRRKAVDRGFVLSDHADWPGLLDAIRATAAQTVWVTHGNAQPLVRVLSEQGLEARAVQTQFEGELDQQEATAPDSGETGGTVEA